VSLYTSGPDRRSGRSGDDERTRNRAKRKIAAAPIDAQFFERFGWIPLPDTDPGDGSQRLEFAWADPHVNVISHGPEEVTRLDEGLSCDRMYRHDSHTQALLVLDEDSVVAVAPSTAELSSAADIDLVRAFRLRAGDAFVLHRGTWHWGPFPIGAHPVHLYNVQGLGYERDNRSVDLSRFGLVVTA
jgi:ureidoglycolate hydrolase